MKKQVREELKTRTREELVKELSDKRLEVSRLSLDISTQKEKNTALLKTKKKEITRILTLLSQKNSEIEK